MIKMPVPARILDVCDKTINRTPIKKQSFFPPADKLPFKTEYESFSESQLAHKTIIGFSEHALLAVAGEAFNEHRPLALSPDMIWLLICQGLSEHIRMHSEQMRDLFVDFDAKETIRVRRDDFIKGKKENAWNEVIPVFSSEVNKRLKGDFAALVSPGFSTTSADEAIAFDICFLDMMSSYFTYEFISLCGIPQIHLSGTPEDWLLIRQKLERLETYGLKWWTDALCPIIEKIAAASAGQTDKAFWNSIYKYVSQSGGPFLDGWITHFFPYVKIHVSRQQQESDFPDAAILSQTTYSADDVFYAIKTRNPHIYGSKKIALKTDSFPSGISRVPFKWQLLSHQYDMFFISGFMGFSQDALTGVLKPEIHWAIAEEQAKKP